jgi:hypothetical protein
MVPFTELQTAVTKFLHGSALFEPQKPQNFNRIRRPHRTSEWNPKRSPPFTASSEVAVFLCFTGFGLSTALLKPLREDRYET